MTEATKEKALSKLDSFTFEIGYPNKFRDFADLDLNSSDLLGNVQNTIAFTWRYHLQELGNPVDKDLWPMPPQTVNAFFEPTQNKCVFLAAILQPPFFNPNGDMSVNYGAIGAVIGHEMTHGFDDSGRRYDAEGKLRDWWSPEDTKEFQKRADAYGRQFLNFTRRLPAGLHIRPGLTMGENIADLGGLTIGFEAYQMWRKRHSYKPLPPMLSDRQDGLEGERRYFAAWAQVWRAKYTQGALENLLTTDPHSPGMARGTIPPQNLEAWYEAFRVVEGDASYLAEADRVQIW